MAHEPGELVDVHLDPAAAVEVAEVGDRADDTEGQELRVAVLGDDAFGLRLLHQSGGVGGVDLGSLAEQAGEAVRALLHLEQCEEGTVLGHEPHRRLGALADAHERLGGEVDGFGLGVAQPRARWIAPARANSASLFSKYQ